MGASARAAAARSTATLAVLATLPIAPLPAQALQHSMGTRSSLPTPHFAREVELAGKSITGFPYFRRFDGFHHGATVEIALDTAAFPEAIGHSCRVWVVADKSAAQWIVEPILVDVRGVLQHANWTADNLGANAFIIDTGTLAADTGDRLGRGYDVVLDFDDDGRLGPHDLIDGSDGAGFWVIGETTNPGPHAVAELLYSGGAFLGQDLYFPSDIAQLGGVPLVVVSHGNGHDYRWYDHIGLHLASWGAVVMSHQNDTGPGPEAASSTTLLNVDFLLSNLAIVAGGALAGHVDPHRMIWIGHSRGGEGIVRAFRRLKDGQWTSPNFDWRDVSLLGAMAPTTQLPTSLTNPGVVSLALLVGGADTDVSSAPFINNSKPLSYFERAQGDRLALYVQGAGHADFHDGGGPCVCAGPALIGAGATHQVLRGYLRALVEMYAYDRVGARQLFERSYQDFRPLGIPANVVVANEWRDAKALGGFVVDDFEQNSAFDTSSSGAIVSYSTSDYYEGELLDFDGSLAFGLGTPMNGMVCGRRDESPHGIVFEWEPTNPGFVEFAIQPANGDVQEFAALSLRASQGTRHPQTDQLDAPLSFTVTLRDRFGHESSIATARYGAITRPYLRTGVGIGAGWINEFSTLRIPLEDFTSSGTDLDLSALRAVRLEFGPLFGSARGRLGIDDVEFTPRRDG